MGRGGELGTSGTSGPDQWRRRPPPGSKTHVGTASPAGRERCLHRLKPTAASSHVLRTGLYRTPAGPPMGAVRRGLRPSPFSIRLPQGSERRPWASPQSRHDPGLPSEDPQPALGTPRPGSTVLGDRLPQNGSCGPRPGPAPPRPQAPPILARPRPAPPTHCQLVLPASLPSSLPPVLSSLSRDLCPSPCPSFSPISNFLLVSPSPTHYPVKHK